ncbi:NUMOD4 domain-containing protein [Vibrio vulnificus]
MKWRKIKDFPNYSVSDTGLVRNDKRKGNYKEHYE